MAWKMEEMVYMVLNSSQDHIKITDKLQNNYHWEPPGTYLNTTTDTQKKPWRD